MNDINYGFVQGRMLLYRKPEMLSLEQHEGRGISPVETPHAHARDVHVLPLTLTEFVTAQKHFPIVFASLEEPVPLAVLGVVEQTNLFINEKGQWDALAYVPAYLRCYPFSLAQHGADKMALIVDCESEAVSEKPEIPFFVDGKPSDYINHMTEFCGRYQTERLRTQEFCKKLVDLELLVGQHVSYTPTG
ncbi:MAG: SapC family protein, partial [Gammaproteobacteria bacterium]|nr:SapC family protein [Gammaproteobacteria bacterium]